LFDESVKLFSQYDKASSSLIQRRLSVGYARAARILDQLYEAGFVGPAEGSKPRDVNMTKVREYLMTVQQS
jgi:DNA segregation ATPase FtsK/SpoIIIE, S-DNA-T family